MHSREPLRNAAAVVLFATAMAWVESAVVLYLRTLVDRLEPYQSNPLPLATGLGTAELVRELATLVMLGTVGYLAGNTWRNRLGYALLAFGVWDIGYYLFLIPLTGWPHSLLDWDILFLIPLPWWGPVLAPVMIAVLMVIGGALLAGGDRTDSPLWPNRWTVLANLLGTGLALYLFMADAIRVAPQGGRALRELLPTVFNWPGFVLAWALMALPVIDLALQFWSRRTRPPGVDPRAFAVDAAGPNATPQL